MFNKTSFGEALLKMNFVPGGGFYEKTYPSSGAVMRVEYGAEKLVYPEQIKGRDRNAGFERPENFVMFECVDRLLEKGYRPEHIELEKAWHLGHDAKGGRADICVTNADGEMLFIIECKTFGKKYQDEYANTCADGGQLFSYWQQERACKWLVLYASDFVNDEVVYTTDCISCTDDNNEVESAKKNPLTKLFNNSHTVEELFNAWDETYDKRFCGDVVFTSETKAYEIGIKPLYKKDLKDFTENDKIVNKFEEILRHNNVSDKENAFNRLVALFICKLVDEIQKNDDDIVEFQYKVGEDTYESLQDRLQRLHKDGMEKFMREDIFYIPDDYAEKLVRQYTGQHRKNMINDLKETLKILKFYTNNDFAFKDVHNEELFYQNARVLVEVVELFQPYKIIGSSDVQFLGNLFEQLLNKGFKQNEGQFFTPGPITRFMWDGLPLDSITNKDGNFEFPRTIDYACGAGHFLTEAVEAIGDCYTRRYGEKPNDSWAANNIYGIEKDYRLARVSKISLFMHGAGDGNIIFGDGLENYPDKGIIPNSFDVLVANPPYSVKSFKPHLKIKDNELGLLNLISNDGSEIETLFVERIAQLVKPDGVAAVILPSSILKKEEQIFSAARADLLKNFKIVAIAEMQGKTFGKTGTPTAIMFLTKNSEPPKRAAILKDSVDAIIENRNLDDWEDKDIIESYLEVIEVPYDTYSEFVSQQFSIEDFSKKSYFKQYYDAFISSSEYKAKIKQKTFKALPEEGKTKWIHEKLYEFALEIEREKLLYFGLVYNQRTVIIRAPEDSKEQQLFLGYKWSDRKGSEGRVPLHDGGLMYNPKDRSDEECLSGIVRAQFCNIEKEVPSLRTYYYHQNLKDMIDFKSVDFKKAIKTTRIRPKRNGNYTTLTLSNKDDFEFLNGDRVINTDEIINGKYPIYSANVYKPFGYTDDLNIDDFSKPSIIWGIDGSWMVGYVPENTPFFPTDHCGVLRVKTNKVVPEYLRYALQVEGEYECYSRYNRPAVSRVERLSIQVPNNKSVQKRCIKEIQSVDAKIKEYQAKISALNDAENALFNSVMLKKDTYEHKPLSELYIPQIGRTPTRSKTEYWDSPDYKWVTISDMGNYDGYTADTAEYISETAVQETSIPLVPAETVIMSFKLTIGRTAITTEPVYTNEAIVAFISRGVEQISNEYLRLYLSNYSWEEGMLNAVKGKTINSDALNNAEIYILPEDVRLDFDSKISKLESEKRDLRKHLNQLEIDKDLIITKYFR